MSKWIDSSDERGTIGYLVETVDNNNLSRHARGVWQVTHVNKAGDRAQIVRLEGEELAAFLERDGYPELIPS